MATPLGADRLVAALRGAGVRVVEEPGWRRHNRNHKGPWGPVHGVMIHHTVTSGAARTVQICRDGYSGLPGPLCHIVITKDGRAHLVGHGRANHAGLGDDDVLRAVVAERGLPADNEANTDGNRHFYGIECENLGNGRDPWPAVQLEAIERVSAAICRRHGWNERSVIGHLEWQPGKIDPRGFSMAGMRARIRDRLAVTPGAPTPPAPTVGSAYTVRPGDTMSGIAQALGVDLEDLVDANRSRVPDPDEIFPGTELTVPASAPTPKPKRPTVDLSRLREAARTNPRMKGTPVTYEGVRVYEAALVDAGLLAKPRLDGHFGWDTVEATSRLQELLGYRGREPGQDADGIPGRHSTTWLGDRYGFDVVS